MTLFIPLLKTYSVKHTTGLGFLTLKLSLVLAHNHLKEFLYYTTNLNGRFRSENLTELWRIWAHKIVIVFN